MDFSFLDKHQEPALLLESSKQQMETAIRIYDDTFGTVLRLQSMRQNPPRPDAQFPTFTARVGYALPDQQRQRDRLLSGEPGANVIPVEMTVNEIVCEWEPTTIGDSKIAINVSSLNDIVSEKLRAILQQKTRIRYRGQDILDIASIRKEANEQIDAAKIADFLLRKCAARDVIASKSAFRDPEIAERSSMVYDDLEATTRYMFIPFEEAWASVLELVDALEIPR